MSLCEKLVLNLYYNVMMDLVKIAEMQQKIWVVRQRRKRQKHLVTDLLLDYAKNSTLHGLRYISERRLTIFERIFWLATFIVSLSLCGYHISNVYVKWRTSPVIVSVSEKMVSVGMVPFPSVTICPQVKCKASVYNFSNKTSHIESLTDVESSEYDSISILCQYAGDHFNMSYAIADRRDSDQNFTQSIISVSPTTADIFLHCVWTGRNGTEYGCRSLFNRVLTAEGVCYNFNGISAEELFRDSKGLATNITESKKPSQGWTPETGYDNSVNPFPHRGKENGAVPDLQVWLYTNVKEIDGLCNGLNSGFKIYLNNPADLPQSSLYYYAAIDNQVSSLAVNLDILNTSESLRSYKPDVRQCYFPDEKYLRFFKIYTAKNCRVECLANSTFRKCNCVGYYMPRYKSTNICRIKDSDCMMEAHQEMVARELEYDPNMHNDKVCRCLPACNNIEYDAEILKTDFKLDSFIKNVDHYEYNSSDETYKGIKFSKIDVYFKKPEFISMRRSELFGWTDFVANIGGLLGVFLGFSLLSLVELLYFLTIRIGFTLKRDLEEEKNTRNTSE